MRKERQRNTALSAITEPEVKFCHLLLAGEHTDAECAELAGFAPTSAKGLKAKPRVQEYLRHYRSQIMSMMANKELDSLIAANVSRNSLLQRAWILANTPPERTRGTITGQVLAIKEMSELLGLKVRTGDKFLDELSDDQLKNYVEFGKPDPTKQ